MSYKNIDKLMEHLNNNGISISEEGDKQKLRNIGYFHGYKGYRFFGTASNKLPFTSFEEVYATVKYDSELKSLLYDKMMFIETAVKNISLESILDNVGSENIQDMYERAVSSYKNTPSIYNIEQKKKAQQDKLNLEVMIHSSLSKAYKANNPKITHFYNSVNYVGVPIWSLFEIMTMGDFGFLLSTLQYSIRDDISKRIGLNISSDTDRQLVYKYIFALKDLRNAIAHNAVIFDTRFKKMDPSKAMKRCLEQEMGLPYVNFKTIGDYIILMCYYLKLLGMGHDELKKFIDDYETIINTYKGEVSNNVSALVIHPDAILRLQFLRNFIN